MNIDWPPTVRERTQAVRRALTSPTLSKENRLYLGHMLEYLKVEDREEKERRRALLDLTLVIWASVKKELHVKLHGITDSHRILTTLKHEMSYSDERQCGILINQWDKLRINGPPKDKNIDSWIHDWDGH